MYAIRSYYEFRFVVVHDRHVDHSAVHHLQQVLGFQDFVREMDVWRLESTAFEIP